MGNTAICIDNVCTAGRAAIGLYSSPSTLAKAFFGASCACGVIGAASSGIAIATSATSIPKAGFIGSISARTFHRLGKDALRLGNVTSGNITDSAA